MNVMDYQQQHFTSEEIIEQRKQYGNLIVFNQKYFHLSIGPQYRYFLMGLAMMAFFQFGILWLVLFNVESQLHRKIGIWLGAITPLSYISTALRDPGTFKPQLCHEPKTKYCHSCQHFTPPEIKHCQKCNICIKGYDHHCPWISKCIGRNNIINFYIFMVSMSLLNMYMYYSFYVIFW